MNKFYIIFASPEDAPNIRTLGLRVEAPEFGDAIKIGACVAQLLLFASGNVYNLVEITTKKRRGVEYVE
jgi:hypothetical protein